MTTLDKTALEAARGAAGSHWSEGPYTRAITAYLDALSSLPAQAVGVKKPLTAAWLAYWPGAGSIDSVTRITRFEHEAKRWRDDGAEVTELVERSAPSQPAAVGEWWKALDQLRADGWAVAVHNDYRLDGERCTFWLLTHSNGRWVKGEGRTDAEALEAALRSTP